MLLKKNLFLRHINNTEYKCPQSRSKQAIMASKFFKYINCIIKKHITRKILIKTIDDISTIKTTQ